MKPRYSRPLSAGAMVGAALTCVNLFTYWLYQKAHADFWNSPAGPRSGTLCVGIDSYFYLIVLSVIVYAAGGIFIVWYAREHLDRQVYVARALLLGSLTAAVVASIATAVVLAIGSPIIAGGFPPGIQPPAILGWVGVCAFCAVPGTFSAIVAGVNYESRMAKKTPKIQP